MPDLMDLILAHPGVAFASSSVSEIVSSEPFGNMPMILPFGCSRMRMPVTGSGGVAVFSAGASG
ncbi:hypothetical protein WJ59_19490 [Burkholderia gladioli]|nr:hypothetical protein WJ59_19490 [Burkholderia gladioli]